jgi:hypothetical protein
MLSVLLISLQGAAAPALRFPMPDGVSAYITSGYDNAPACDHGGSSMGPHCIQDTEKVRAYQLYGLDFIPEGENRDIVSPVDATIFSKGDDWLYIQYYQAEPTPHVIQLVVAHFDSSEVTFKGWESGMAVAEGQKLGERSNSWIHLSAHHQFLHAGYVYQVPLPFIDGYEVFLGDEATEPERFGDLRLDGRSFQPFYDNTGGRGEFEYHANGALTFIQGGDHQPAPGAGKETIQPGRWIGEIYGHVEDQSYYYLRGAPSYYRVSLPAPFAKLDFDGGDLDLSGLIDAEEWQVHQDWPPQTMVKLRPGEQDQTRFKAIFSGWFDFPQTRDYTFRTEFTNRIDFSIDGERLEELSPPENNDQVLYGDFADIFLTAGLHHIEVTYTSLEPPPGVQPRARLWVDWDDDPCGLEAFNVQYHRTPRLNDPLFESDCDTAISHNWGYGTPLTQVPQPTNFFSASWDGLFTFAGGSYDFTLQVAEADLARLLVDADTLLEQTYYNPWPATLSGQTALSAGQHRIQLQYVELVGRAGVSLAWEPSPGPAIGCVTGTLLEWGWDPVTYPVEFYIRREEEWILYATVLPDANGDFCAILEEQAEYWLTYINDGWGYPRECDANLSVGAVGADSCALPAECEDLGEIDFYCES